jgi:glycosyltransferase involved in cell wall biosynthesis
MLLHAVEATRAAGFRPVVFALRRGAIVDELDRLGVLVLSAISPSLPIDFISALRRLQPPIVHAHLMRARGLAALAKVAGFNGKIVATDHGRTDDRIEGRRATRVWRGVEAFVNAQTDRVIAVSAYQDSLLRKIQDPLKVVRIDNCVSAAVASSSIASHERADSFDLLGIGRLAPAKGWDVLLGALSLLRNKGRRVSCRLVGAGAERATLESLIRSMHLSSDVRIEEPTHSPDIWMSRARVVACPSRWESFGMVAAEALFLRRAVVAARTGGLIEVVQDPRLLHEPGSASSLAYCLESILFQVPRVELAELLRPHHERARVAYDPRRFEDELAALYRFVVTQSGPPLHSD